MEQIFGALIGERFVLFEGACGTGKTLSALVPALSVGERLGKVVVIATNVHQQMEQFIEETREIRRKKRVNVVVLTGKMLMCPHPDMDYDRCKLLRENTFELVDAERESGVIDAQLRALGKKYEDTGDPEIFELRSAIARDADSERDRIRGLRRASCNELYELLRSDPTGFREWLFGDVRRPEEVADWAYQRGVCGYELLKREMKAADLVICNYHHLLNASIFDNLLGWLERGANDIIAIFDEAHNIESAARNHSSLTLSEITLDRAFGEVVEDRSGDREGIGLLFSLVKNLIHDSYESRLKFGESERIGEHWQDLRICDPLTREDLFKEKLEKVMSEAGLENGVIDDALRLGDEFEKRYEREFKAGRTKILKSSSTLAAATFLQQYLRENGEYYPILNIRRDDNKLTGRLELFISIPRHVTKPLFEKLHSAVLMSATLAPFEMVKTTLGMERDTTELAFGLSFPPERRRTLAVNVPPLFARDRKNPETIEMITSVLTDIINETPGNLILFFQSASVALQYYQHLELNIPLFLDEIGVSAQRVREEFFKIGENGGKAVLFTYLWGTLTEGVDYRDGRARCVVVIGVGYPALNDRMRAIESAYDAEFGRGWDYAIQIPTTRKVRQALGRVIRSPEDFGLRVLVDARYTPESMKTLRKYSVHNAFPEDEQREMIEVAPQRVKYAVMNFFSEISEPIETKDLQIKE
ncbi:damage-inducible protein [Methanosarcinales archaeon ex4572_44]|nr:MAG: damage-inducible protein [Methanosarcinales archaeon ex4484_138]PHP46043.1 MAG: damage-inducible protein [Methanosarcinales archaeon ex4572_44]